MHRFLTVSPWSQLVRESVGCVISSPTDKCFAYECLKNIYGHSLLKKGFDVYNHEICHGCKIYFYDDICLKDILMCVAIEVHFYIYVKCDYVPYWICHWYKKWCFECRYAEWILLVDYNTILVFTCCLFSLKTILPVWITAALVNTTKIIYIYMPPCFAILSSLFTPL